jgi:hypothetical protein
LASQFAVIGGVGLLLGVACVFVSPSRTLVGLLGLGFILLVFKRPELLPLAYLLATSSVTRVTKALSVSLGFGTLYVTDAFLVLIFGLVVARALAESDFKILSTPLDWPLLLFAGASFVSTGVAISTGSLPWKQSLGEVRTVMGYLLFFGVTNLVRDKRQLKLLVRGLIVIAGMVAVATIAQYVMGQSEAILAGRIEGLDTEGELIAGVTRVIPPGQSLLVVGFTFVFVTLVLDRSGLSDTLRASVLGLLGTAILMTFFRASWVAVGLTVAVVVGLAGGRDRKRVVQLGIVAAIAVGGVAGAVALDPESRGGEFIRAAVGRLGSLANRATYEDPGSSLRWRDFEYSYAVPHIMASPVVGLGLGARYRPFVPPRDYAGFDGRDFIHNGHVWVLLKGGLLAYIGLMAFSIGVVHRGLKGWRRLEDPSMRGIAAACALVFVGMLIVSIVEPYIMTPSWTPVLGVVAGINEAGLEIAMQGRPSVRISEMRE